MIPSFYRNQWEELKRSGCRAEELWPLAEQVALTFLDRHYFNHQFETDLVRVLCEMATFFPDESLNRVGASALFGIAVESLCDDFEELQTEAYNRLMCTILSYCRELPGGRELHERMEGFGLTNFDALYRRSEWLRKTSGNFRDLPARPAKLLVLSRMTLGADVAVTSVLIQRLKRLFPDAPLVVIGDGKLHELFGGNPALRIRPVGYVRSGGLMERLRSWFQVEQAIETERADCDDAECLVVDPDSRLSQLGVLPLVNDRHYLFFNSRSSPPYPAQGSISELANYWFSQVTGANDFSYPTVWLPRETNDRAREFCRVLRVSGCRKIVAVNFGVGSNARKRIGGDFEGRVLRALLQEPQTVVLLDKGFGEEELQRSNELMESMRALGHATLSRTFANLEPAALAQGLIGIQAGIGEEAALIGTSDEFIGYDSACQHIAAALAIPTYTIFAGSNNTRFVRRWRPFGLGLTEVIHVDTLTHPPVFDPAVLVRRLQQARR